MREVIRCAPHLGAQQILGLHIAVEVALLVHVCEALKDLIHPVANPAESNAQVSEK